MAALMKKRVLAEFNQSQTTTEPPIKRLRTLRLTLSKNGDSGSTLAYIQCLQQSKSPNDAMQFLVRIGDTISQMNVEDIPECIKILTEKFQSEQDSTVRANILSVLAELGEASPDVNEKLRIIHEVVNLLKNEESHRVKSRGLATLLKLGDYNKILVLKVAREHLPDTWHGVQTRCLSIIGRYLSPSIADDTLSLIGNYTRSQDPRVRAQAFDTMAELHSERGCRLPASFYSEACAAIRDDYEIVRRAVLKLIWLLGNEYTDTMVPGTEGEDIRMIDSAFSKICGLMGDLSPRVRAAAMSFLGKMKGVSRRYIEQALDKKQKRNIDDENSEVAEERSGSCGAFIHGLEDEFLEVRTAAVESLCSLSLENSDIASIALDFMVDMFNDEIQDVRIRAIESLGKMSVTVVLREDQLETILPALEDFCGEVREGLHITLASSRLATRNCLNMCVNRLLDNLARYPQDKESIRSCLAALGRTHPYLTLPLTQLLGRHPFFDMPEPDVDEPSYASILVLIFNAALHCPSMHALFTEHTIKHYHYLRDTMPHLVPRLGPVLAESSTLTGELEEDDEIRDQRGKEFLERMVSSVENARPGSRVYSELLGSAVIEIDRLAEMDRRMEGAARFTALYIRCLILLRSITKNLTASHSPSMNDATSNTSNKVSTLLQYAQQLQTLFLGMGENETILANDLWLKALAVDLVRVSRKSSAVPIAHRFLAEIDAMSQDTTKLPPFSRSLVVQLPTLIETNADTLSQIVMPMLAPAKQVEEKLPRPTSSARFCYALIEEPKSDSDTALKFTGGLLLGIPLTAKIFNMKDPSILRIKLRHPDQQVQLLLPRKSDLKPVNSEKNNYRLRTTVLLSHQVWMEACNVEISIALLAPLASSCLHSPVDDPCVIDLCKPTKVAIAPKPVKRGI